MNWKRIVGKILKTPLVALGIIGIPASAYAAYTKIADISYGATVIFVIISIAYFVGFYMDRSGWFESKTTKIVEENQDEQYSYPTN